jgi:hypothetical protein
MSDEQDRDLIRVEALLEQSAAHFPYPATPPLAGAVLARVREQRAPVAPFGGLMRLATAGAALAAIAVVALVAAVSIPASRSALADFFHLSRVRIERKAVTSTPPALAPGSFARPVSLEELRDTAGFPLLLPRVDGKMLEPDAVYLQGEEFDAPIAILSYETAGYDLYETRMGYINKIITGPEPVQEISFSGHPAYWVEQGGHIVQFLDPAGRVVVQTERSVDRATLVWEEDGITYRIESSLSQAETVAVAESLRWGG